MGITRAEALDCLKSDDLIGIGMEADALRRRLHPDGIVTYAIGTPVDVSAVLRGGAGVDTLIHEVGRQINAGATGVRILGCNSTSQATAVVQTLRMLRHNFPGVWLEIPVSELASIVGRNGITAEAFIPELQNAGLDGLGAENATAGDPEEHSGDVIGLYRAAHNSNMASVASVRFGVGTPVEQRLERLVQLYELQTATGSFQAVSVVAVPPANGRELDGVTAVENLKMLATARMFLDNIPHVLATRSAHGLKVLQTSLRFGANDLGWVLPIAGHSDSPQDAPEEDMRRVIRDAGFAPVERDARYTTMMAV